MCSQLVDARIVQLAAEPTEQLVRLPTAPVSSAVHVHHPRIVAGGTASALSERFTAGFAKLDASLLHIPLTPGEPQRYASCCLAR